MEGTTASFFAALALAATHLLAGHLPFTDPAARRAWLSFAGGVGVAYVFVHLLPELADAQRLFDKNRTGFLRFLEQHVYVFALGGLAMYYAVERAVKLRRRRGPRDDAAGVDAVFWVHMASFAIYNGLIGYLLVDRRGSPYQMAWFTLAIGLHFMVMDYGLREDHRTQYHRYGRWLLSSAVLVGWAFGQVIAVSDTALTVLLAFLSGAIVFNVIKEELPPERESRLGPFVAGAALYAGILITL